MAGLNPNIALGTQAPQQQQNPLAGIASLLQIVQAIQQQKRLETEGEQKSQLFPLQLQEAQAKAQKAQEARAFYTPENMQQFRLPGLAGIAAPSDEAGGGPGRASVPGQLDFDRMLSAAAERGVIDPEKLADHRTKQAQARATLAAAMQDRADKIDMRLYDINTRSQDRQRTDSQRAADAAERRYFQQQRLMLTAQLGNAGLGLRTAEINSALGPQDQIQTPQVGIPQVGAAAPSVGVPQTTPQAFPRIDPATQGQRDVGSADILAQKYLSSPQEMANIDANITQAQEALRMAGPEQRGVIERDLRGMMRAKELRGGTVGNTPAPASNLSARERGKGGAPKPLTEFQGKAQMFGTRAAEADKILTPIEDGVSNLGLNAKRMVEGVPVVSAIANASLTENQQKVEQARRNFVNAVLRQESGAVITEPEFANAIKQYFPQPGDSKAVIEQKRANRKSVIDGFALTAGTAASRVQGAQRRETDNNGLPSMSAIDAEIARRQGRR